MDKIADERFEYTDDRYPLGSKCACRLRIWKAKHGRRFLILMTQLEPAPGASVTNTVETIATEAVHRFNISKNFCAFVEHYEHERSPGLDETFDHVEFTWRYDEDGRPRATEPIWSHCTAEEFEQEIAR